MAHSLPAYPRSLLIPALAFWGLDAFYLGQERDFRKLHKDVVAGKADAFLLDPAGYVEGVGGWFGSVFSRSVLPFHLTLVVAVSVIALVVWLIPGVGGAPPGDGGETTALLEERSLPHG